MRTTLAILAALACAATTGAQVPGEHILSHEQALEAASALDDRAPLLLHPGEGEPERLRFAAGAGAPAATRAVRYDFSLDQTLDGRPIDVRAYPAIDAAISYRVTDSTASAFRIAATFTELGVVGGAGVAPALRDEFADVATALAGSRVVLTRDRSGATTNTDRDYADPAHAGFGGRLARIVTDAAITLPGEPIAPGAVWRIKRVDVLDTVTFTTITTYHLEARDQSTITVGFHGRYIVEEQDVTPDTAPDGATMTLLAGSGQTVGVTRVNLDTAIPERATVVSDTDIEMTYDTDDSNTTTTQRFRYEWTLTTPDDPTGNKPPGDTDDDANDP
jgi:hypothetical protein